MATQQQPVELQQPAQVSSQPDIHQQPIQHDQHLGQQQPTQHDQHLGQPIPSPGPTPSPGPLPPYTAPGQPADPSHPMPASNLPGQPIAMQPMPGQNVMSPSQPGATVTPLHLLQEQPQFVDCQMCHKRAKTKVVTSGEGMQFLTGAVLCLVCICLTPLPCCLHWFEETTWYCTECNAQIAYKTHDAPIQVTPPPHVANVPSMYANGPQPGPGGPPQDQPPYQQPQPYQQQPAQSPPPKA